MPTRVILIRHGETEWNASGRWQGNAPVPLNKNGRTQAQLAATHLIKQSIDYIISSDLSRAFSTAEIIAAELRLPVTLDQQLRECDLGDWQGLIRAEVESWDRATFDHFMTDPFNIPRPGGESLCEVGQRGCEALLAYVQQYPNSTLLLVSHGGTINSILQTLFTDYQRRGLPNTSLSELHYHTNKTCWELVTVGETPHLPEYEPD